MQNVDRVWARQHSRFPGANLNQFRIQAIINAFTLSSGASAQNQPVAFGAGAILLGVGAAAQIVGQAGTAANRAGLDLFSASCIYQADNRSLIGTAEGIASSIFGPNGDQFPPMELYLPQNTSLLYNLTNLTTSTILITLAHHVLLPQAS
jgi:hypothetical protein